MLWEIALGWFYFSYYKVLVSEMVGTSNSFLYMLVGWFFTHNRIQLWCTETTFVQNKLKITSSEKMLFFIKNVTFVVKFLISTTVVSRE